MLSGHKGGGGLCQVYCTAMYLYPRPNWRFDHWSTTHLDPVTSDPHDQTL
jgi:hypothetical protein